MSSTDRFWMLHALKLAQHAAEIGEVPVGAVLVKENEILSEAWNQSISDNDPTAHAEILALRKAALVEQNYRLPDTTLYVTLEPCLMCYGALVNARVGRLVYGAGDSRFGVVNKVDRLVFNHQLEITCGILEEDCAELLADFFKQKRKHNPTD